MSAAVVAPISTTGPSVTPGPPPIPSHLAPNAPEFSGYKLEPQPLPTVVIPLQQPLCTVEDTGECEQPHTFLALSHKLKTNQLAILRSEDPEQGGAHAVYYVDHAGVWQLNPPGADTPPPEVKPAATSSPGKSQSPSSQNGSHCIYRFDTLEDGDGLSFLAVAPCFLLLTRAGGRLTIFQVDPNAGRRLTLRGSDVPPLVVLFDGSPLSPAPLVPHHATLSSALLSAKRDMLFIVLYEFWEDFLLSPTAKIAAAKKLNFVHEGQAIRSSGSVAPSPVTEGFSAISSQSRALHKLTAVQFRLNNVQGLSGSAPSSSWVGGEDVGGPSADLVHSFSSVQNYALPKDETPLQHAADSNWSAPLACWLKLPTEAMQRSPSAITPPPALAAITPPNPPFLWFIAARVPYLNETESVVHELERRRLDEDAERRVRDRADEEGAEAVPIPGIGAAAAAGGATSNASSQSTNPNFTSETILSDTHNLKHYAVDREDDDEEGDGAPGKLSLNSQVDVSVQLFDVMGNRLASRPLRQQTFLFAHTIEPIVGVAGCKERSYVMAVKQHDALLLYDVSAAPQPADSMVHGAAGSLRPSASSNRVGIVFRPLFSFAGLGYVQSGKQFKKFFMDDGSHHFIILAEFTRLVHVYGRPTSESPTAPQYLMQFSCKDDEEDEGQQIYGMQTAIVPRMSPTPEPSGGTVQGKPLLYVLTRHACRQFQLPMVALQ